MSFFLKKNKGREEEGREGKCFKEDKFLSVDQFIPKKITEDYLSAILAYCSLAYLNNQASVN